MEQAPESEKTTPQAQPATVASSTPAPTDAEQHRKLVGVLSYISILVVLAYIMAKNDPKLLFHVKQGVVLFVAEVATMVVFQMFLMMLWPLASLLNLGFLVLSVIGILHVLKGQDKELPLIGHLAVHVPL